MRISDPFMHATELQLMRCLLVLCTKMCPLRSPESWSRMGQLLADGETARAVECSALSRWNLGSFDYRFESRYHIAKSQEVQCRTELLVTIESEKGCDFPEDAVTQCNVRDTGSRVFGSVLSD
jgi:hypothetical protein